MVRMIMLMLWSTPNKWNRCKSTLIILIGDDLIIRKIRQIMMIIISNRVEMAKSEERESELAQRTECFV